MEEKTCVVTGATSGIGLETARALARAGASVIGVGRDAGRAARAEEEIRADTGNGHVYFETENLSRREGVLALARRISLARGRIDVLVNNAGIFASAYRETPDGIETQFAVNHLAGFLLTYGLLPLLRAAPRARVIGLSSGSHFRGRVHWKDVGLRRFYSGLAAYGQSKLAVVLFTYELARRLGAGSTVDAFAVDPGLVKTGIGFKGTGILARAAWNLRARGGVAPRESAASIAYLALSPEARGRTGLYWKDRAAVPSSRASYSAEDAARLWRLSEEMCGGISFL
jgi:NAD(P)-dependent dehydrogenase (short-subunit alcohol dehydrogenase family)